MKLKLPKIKRVRLRMTLYFTALIIMVILAINFFTCLIFSNELVRQKDYVVQRKMHTIVRDIHGKIAIVRNLCIDIQKDDTVAGLLSSRGNSREYSELMARRRRVTALLDNYTLNNKLIKKIILIDEKKNILDFDYLNEESSRIVLNDRDFLAFSNSSFYEEFSLSGFLAVDDNNYMNSSNRNINYLNKFRDNSYNRLGYLIVSIDTDVMFDYTEIFCREIFDSAYIVNSKGELIYNVGPISFGKEIVDTGREWDNLNRRGLKTINGKKYLVFDKPLSYNTDWSIIGIISYENLTENVKIMSVTIYLIGIVCIIAVTIVSSYIAKSITKPIIKVNKAISRIDKGEWPDSISINSEDEMKHLVDGINRMVKNLKGSFQRIYEEEENKKKAEIKALQFQLEFLQSQINPHFIYNTLNTISYFALKNGDQRLRELIQSFNMLLRYSMSIKSSFITVAKELDFIDRYLKIQECRYGEIFEIDYQVPEEVLQSKIPKLVLQPLIENAIFHGIAPKGSKGIIKVEFIRENELIRVRVIDDGVGICENNIRDMLSGKVSSNSKGYNNIGLSNINDRLKLYYGEKSTLQIYSSQGMGTTVEFYIPFADSEPGS